MDTALLNSYLTYEQEDFVPNQILTANDMDRLSKGIYNAHEAIKILRDSSGNMVGQASEFNPTSEIFNDYDGNNVIGDHGHAEGYRTKTTYDRAHAEGDHTVASWRAHAEGGYTEATGSHSHAEGAFSVASGQKSHAEGVFSQQIYYIDGEDIPIKNRLVLIRATESDEEFNKIQNGDIIYVNTLNHGLEVGDLISLKVGPGEATDTRKIIEINGDEIQVNHTFNEPQNNLIKTFPFPVGTFIRKATPTIAQGDSSHAEGVATLTEGKHSHAEGAPRYKKIQITYDKDGEEQTMLDSNIEQQTIASGETSHAEGMGTQAIGNASHSEGVLTKAEGNGSHAEGWGTIASTGYSHVQGKYNEIDTNKKYAHIVGWGSGPQYEKDEQNNIIYDNITGEPIIKIPAKRKNIHTIDTQGNAWFAKNLSIDGDLTVKGKLNYDIVIENQVITPAPHKDSHINGNDKILPGDIGAASNEDLRNVELQLAHYTKLFTDSFYTFVCEISNNQEWTEDVESKTYYTEINDLNITAQDNPIVDIYADNASDYLSYEDNFSNVFRIQTDEGKIIIWSRVNNPGPFNIQVKVVKKHG